MAAAILLLFLLNQIFMLLEPFGLNPFQPKDYLEVYLEIYAYDEGVRAIPLYVAIIPLDSFELDGRIYPDHPLLFEGGYYDTRQRIAVEIPKIPFGEGFRPLTYIVFAATQTRDSILIGSRVFTIKPDSEDVVELKIEFNLTRYPSGSIECIDPPRREFERYIAKNLDENQVKVGEDYLEAPARYRFKVYHPIQGCWIATEWTTYPIKLYQKPSPTDLETLTLTYRHTQLTYGQGTYYIELETPHDK